MTTIPIDEVKRELLKNIEKEERSIEIAEAMLDEGIPVRVVGKCTGLDMEEVFGLTDE